MATLTIKPTAAGNDVQIKSGDGNTTHATFGDTNNISMSTGSIASAVTGTLGSGIVFPAGVVLQSKTTELKDTWSWTNTTGNTDGTSSTRANDSYGGVLTGLTTTVTAKGVDSDFLISGNLAQVSLSDHGSYNFWFRIYSSLDTYATPVSQGNAYSSNTRVTGGSWFTWGGTNYISLNFPFEIKHTGATLAKDSPVTYKICFSSHYSSGGNTVYVNRLTNHSTGDHILATVSSMSVTEIAT